MWRDETVNQGQGTARDDIVFPQKIDYRATSPVYAGEPYRVHMNADAVDKKEADVQVVSNDGTVCMKGTVTDWS